MRIEYVSMAIFHKEDPIKIKESNKKNSSCLLGNKRKDDNFEIEFTSNKNFLVFHEKDEHYERVECDMNGKASTEISIHRKLTLITIQEKGNATQYHLEIKHNNHKSMLCFSKTKKIKIFLHSNGHPDSFDIDTHKNHYFMHSIFQLMNEAELPKIPNT